MQLKIILTGLALCTTSILATPIAEPGVSAEVAAYRASIENGPRLLNLAKHQEVMSENNATLLARQWTSGWDCSVEAWHVSSYDMKTMQEMFGRLFGKNSYQRLDAGHCVMARCYYKYFGFCNSHTTMQVNEVDYARDRVWEQPCYGWDCTNVNSDPYTGYVFGRDGEGPGRYGDDWRYC